MDLFSRTDPPASDPHQRSVRQLGSIVGSCGYFSNKIIITPSRLVIRTPIPFYTAASLMATKPSSAPSGATRPSPMGTMANHRPMSAAQRTMLHDSSAIASSLVVQDIVKKKYMNAEPRNPNLKVRSNASTEIVQIHLKLF